MAVLLYRVDERLIHGQVVVGWGGRLHPSRILVVDDDLAGSSWEKELYAAGVPLDMEAEFRTVAEAQALLPEWQESQERLLLLTRDVATMSRLASTGLLRGREVNIGGIHHAPGRSQVLRYVFLSDAERRQLEALGTSGVEVIARDVPNARAVALRDLVRDP
ncbi:MAG TPA: PTS sugar transporter subunit IIB [Longimicrobiales bacterium]|nr:PTS sugar transporter subunit IIB [Longimicrobiales bacterium]